MSDPTTEPYMIAVWLFIMVASIVAVTLPIYIVHKENEEHQKRIKQIRSGDE